MPGRWDLSKVQSVLLLRASLRCDSLILWAGRRWRSMIRISCPPSVWSTVLALADRGGLRDLADKYLSDPTDKGANPGLKIASLVGGIIASADSIDDMAVLRHGGTGRVFARAYAPSTSGSSCG